MLAMAALPSREIAEAQRAFKAKRHIGKLVLVVPPADQARTRLPNDHERDHPRKRDAAARGTVERFGWRLGPPTPETRSPLPGRASPSCQDVAPRGDETAPLMTL